MTGKDRISRILSHGSTDRIGIFEHFWPETVRKWQQLGYLNEDELVEEHFGLDIQVWWSFDLTADLNAGETVIEEDENIKIIRSGNGALLKWWKNKSGAPEHLDFEVKDRKGWEEKIRPLLTDKSFYPRRVCRQDEWDYSSRRARANKGEKFFCCAGANVFESMHPVCGHEYLLMGMALDPDWIRDMCDVYSNLIIELMEITFAKEGKPDGIWIYEDMGFKNKPFMSPQMYKDLVWPGHKKTIDYAHDHGLPVIMHSCGYVEPFIPSLIEAGLDCLQAMEVKAGMDLLKLKKLYGKEIALCGGLDIRVLESNNLSLIGEYLDEMLPVAMENGGYILHTDHSIPETVEYETYKYFLEKAMKIGMYKV